MKETQYVAIFDRIPVYNSTVLDFIPSKPIKFLKTKLAKDMSQHFLHLLGFCYFLEQ